MYRSARAFSISCVLVCAAIFVAPHAAAAQTIPVCPFSWDRDLHEGSIGTDVERLQQFLNRTPHTVVAMSGSGSLGHETRLYERKTSRAVTKFQEMYREDILAPAHLNEGSGEVGERTRAKLNALCAMSAAADIASTSTRSSNALTVAGSIQPESAIVPSGAGGVPLINLTLTAGDQDVTVQSITVERVGLGADGSFQNIALNDATGIQIGEELSFNANHRVIFAQPFVVAAHTSQTVSVVANMAGDLTSFVGQMPAVQVDAVAASSPVSGSFPIKSAPLILNSTLVIGATTVALSPLDPNTHSNHYVNDTSVRFSAIRITANSQEDVTLSSIIWNQSGTASSGDIAHVVTVVNGSSTPTVVHGHDYISFFSPVIVIPRGQSIDVSVQGDVLQSGANRTVEFDIFDNSDDIGLSGNGYGFGVGISPSGNTATAGHSVFITSDGTTGGNTGTPFFSGSVTTINGATVTSIGNAH